MASEQEAEAEVEPEQDAEMAFCRRFHIRCWCPLSMDLWYIMTHTGCHSDGCKLMQVTTQTRYICRCSTYEARKEDCKEIRTGTRVEKEPCE